MPARRRARKKGLRFLGRIDAGVDRPGMTVKPHKTAVSGEKP
jgi:hypothetical protein